MYIPCSLSFLQSDNVLESYHGLPESCEETTYEYAYSIENDSDKTGYIKPSQLNTQQCEYVTIADPLPTSNDNINEDHNDEYLELSTK